MGILAVYIGIIIAGDAIAVGIGEIIDRISPTLSLPIFLAMFFAIFYLGWQLALRLTEPKAKPQA